MNQAEFGQADAQSAEALLEESCAIWRELGERRHLAFANADLGTTAVWQGNFGLARSRFDESLSTFTELDDETGLANVLFSCARLFVAEGKHEQGARVFGATYGLAKTTTGRILPIYDSIMERRLDSARTVLGPELVSAAWTEGQDLSLQAATAYARQHLGVSVLDV